MTVLDYGNGKRSFYLILSSTIQILTAHTQKKTHMYIDTPQKDLIKMSVHMKGSHKFNPPSIDKCIPWQKFQSLSVAAKGYKASSQTGLKAG